MKLPSCEGGVLPPRNEHAHLALTLIPYLGERRTRASILRRRTPRDSSYYEVKWWRFLHGHIGATPRFKADRLCLSPLIALAHFYPAISVATTTLLGNQVICHHILSCYEKDAADVRETMTWISRGSADTVTASLHQSTTLIRGKILIACGHSLLSSPFKRHHLMFPGRQLLEKVRVRYDGRWYLSLDAAPDAI